MNTQNPDRWQHNHDFEIHDSRNERRVLLVVGLTIVTMGVEIIAGMLFGSMALLADGWHMGTHAAALGITAAAYYYARKHAHDRRFAFGTGKVGVLGGYSSAVVLAVVALLMAAESTERLFSPQHIRFNEALIVASIGLVVNIVSALLLQQPHRHEHTTDDHAHSRHHHHDHNMRSAYLHVMTDALTSVLAIAALTAGKIWQWVWLDAAMGMVGALIIAHWAKGLLRDTGKILLDRDVRQQTVQQVYELIEDDGDSRITDLHIWKIGANQMAAVISLVTHKPKPPEAYKSLLIPVRQLSHVSVEVHHCDAPCDAQG